MPSLGGGLGVGLATGLALGLTGAWVGTIYILAFGEAIFHLDTQMPSLGGGLGVGLATGLTLGLTGGLVWGMTVGLRIARDFQISLTKPLRWNLSRHGLAVGLAGALAVGLASVLAVDLAGVLAVGLAGALTIRLGYDEDITDNTRPNQGIRLTVVNALRVGLIWGLAVGLAGRQAGGLAVGLAVGLIVGSGAAVIQHVALRTVLWRQGDIPWNYARFLDEAAEMSLLRKVGGGYIFVHRYLLDYFAGRAE